MSNPINEMRNFKQNRNNPLHHARANEAQVEVTIETESETVTCEMNSMKNATNNVEMIRPSAAAETTIDDVKAEMNTLASTIKEVLEKPTTATEEDTMENTTAQTETISITSVTDRYNTLRRNAVIGCIAGNVANIAGMAGGAYLNGRNVKRAAVIGAALGAVNIAWVATSKLQKKGTEFAAEVMDEEEYQNAAKPGALKLAGGLALSTAVGALIGAFAIRKVVSSAE